MSAYALTKAYYPAQSRGPTLLIEGLNAKDILMDIIQVAVSSGAVVGTGGAGGDIVTDALFASSEAKEVLETVTTIINELQEVGSIIKAAAELDFSGNPDAFYAEVKGLLKKTVASAAMGDKAKEYIKLVHEKISKIIAKLVRAISKWVAALFPDDFGLSGPAFEGSVGAAISAAGENSYKMAVGAVEALGETGELLTNSVALESFLDDMVTSILDFAKEVDAEIQTAGEDTKGVSGKMRALWATQKFTMEMRVAPLAWAARQVGFDTDTMGEDFMEYIRAMPQGHPYRKLMQKITPKAIFILEEIQADWIPTTAKVLHKLTSWLFACIAIFQMVMDDDERAEILAVKTRDVLDLGLDDLGVEFSEEDLDMSQKRLAAHKYLENELLLREVTKTRLILDNKMKITKTQLKRMIREERTKLIYEAEFYDETPEGQVLGTKAEDDRFNLQTQVENDVKSAIVQAVKAGLDVNTAVEAALRATDQYQGY